MKVSELIKELQKQIEDERVGDREVYFYNESIRNFDKIEGIYSTTGSIECISLCGEEK